MNTRQETIAQFIAAVNRTIPKPVGPFALVTRHGRKFTPAPLPPDVKPGTRQACFANCASLAIRWRRFVYCEGYAAGIIPVLHAWLTDENGDGYVIDPTWTGGKNLARLGHDYFGVAIKTSYLIRHYADRIHDGRRYYEPLLDDWSNDYPICKAPVNAWKHQLNTP